MSSQPRKPLMNFKTMAQTEVPQGRNGKHKRIVTQILSDLDQLKDGNALKVPLVDLPQSQGEGAFGPEPGNSKTGAPGSDGFGC